MSLIVSYVGQIDEYEYVKGSNPVPPDTSVFAALYYAVHAVPLLPLIGILVFFGVGALVSGSFALWKTLRSPKKSNLPAPQTQTEGSSSESPRTQTEENSNESGPPPFPLPRRPR